jgi:peroxiredoxin
MEHHVEFLRSSGAVDQILKPGATAPAFTLKNQHGEDVSSAELLKRGPLVVSFTRGSWCPYCSAEVRALNEAYDQFQQAGIELVVLSPQSIRRAQKQATADKLKFNLLVDTDNQVGKAFVRMVPSRHIQMTAKNFPSIGPMLKKRSSSPRGVGTVSRGRPSNRLKATRRKSIPRSPSTHSRFGSSQLNSTTRKIAAALTRGSCRSGQPIQEHRGGEPQFAPNPRRPRKIASGRGDQRTPPRFHGLLPIPVSSVLAANTILRPRNRFEPLWANY